MSQFHVFADASGNAYGGVAYLLWSTTEGLEVCQVSTKVRVAPLRQPTISQLELMAALIASRLAKTIYDEFKIKPSSMMLWPDSKIVLYWLRSESASLKAFVGVCVTEIQSTWEPSLWRFAPTDLNLSDDLSQGIPVEEINGCWKMGPEFLNQNLVTSSPSLVDSSPNAIHYKCQISFNKCSCRNAIKLNLPDNRFMFRDLTTCAFADEPTKKITSS